MSVQLAPLSWLGITADSANYFRFNDTIWSTPSTFTLQCPSTLPSQQQTSSPLSSSTFRNCNRLSILASSRGIFGHARASYDNWTFLNPGTWALPPFGESVADYDYQSLCNKLSWPSASAWTCGAFWAILAATPYDDSMPSVTYGAETSHTLPYTSFITSLHTYLSHTTRHASLPFNLACASGASPDRCSRPSSHIPPFGLCF